MAVKRVDLVEQSRQMAVQQASGMGAAPGFPNTGGFGRPAATAVAPNRKVGYTFAATRRAARWVNA